MTRTSVYIIAAIAVIVLGIGAFMYANQNSAPNATSTENGNQNQIPNTSSTLPSSGGSVGNNEANLIRVKNPQPNDVISSPLVVEGEARGTWYFEASFPVKLFDGKGNEIAAIPAQAQGEWMTTDFVPFKATLTFNNPNTATGTLVLQNDNPSGLPENAKEIRIPIRFSAGTTLGIKAFFGNSKMDPGASDCNRVFPVIRTIPKTLAVGRAAIEELLKGPSASEKSQGYYTSIPDGVKIQSLSIENGVAKIDFNSKLEEGVGGSCRVSAIRAQIVETLKQFPTVNQVVISIDGRIEDILQP